MTLTGERFGAGQAAAAGLLSAVTEDEAALDAWVDGAARPSGNPPRARWAPPRRCCGRCRAQGWTEGLAAAAATSAELFAGPEAAEGMDAFLQKRRPCWDATP